MCWEDDDLDYEFDDFDWDFDYCEQCGSHRCFICG